MKAAVITGIGKISVESVPDPICGPKDVILEVIASGICGTDLHILQGEFAPSLPIIPGHEFSGVITEVGKEVVGFKVGDKVAGDPSLYCGECFYCKRARGNMCENWNAIGVTKPGAAAEHVHLGIGGGAPVHGGMQRNHGMAGRHPVEEGLLIRDRQQSGGADKGDGVVVFQRLRAHVGLEKPGEDIRAAASRGHVREIAGQHLDLGDDHRLQRHAAQGQQGKPQVRSGFLEGRGYRPFLRSAWQGQLPGGQGHGGRRHRMAPLDRA